MTQVIDRTALSHWFPIIHRSGLPVPATTIVMMDRAVIQAFIGVLDGVDPGTEFEPFFNAIGAAADVHGYPCFLRTDHTSAKHSWEDSCHLTSVERIPRQVFQIIEFSEMCDFIGLPWSVWAVREMLPIKPAGVCPHYGNMPVNREFRFFVRDAEVVCHHPYWPDGALADGGFVPKDGFDPTAFNALFDDEIAELSGLASKAGAAVGGAWSIDFLETDRGWFLTDMAEAHKSFHWEGCTHNSRRAAA